MKTLVLMFLMLCVCGVTLAETDNLLSGAEEIALLDSIDNICGDTWCEGEYDFSFNQWDCSAKSLSCTLFFDMILYSYSEGERDVYELYPVTCSFQVNSKADLMDQHGEYSAWLYDELSQCISDYEGFL